MNPAFEDRELSIEEATELQRILDDSTVPRHAGKPMRSIFDWGLLADRFFAIISKAGGPEKNSEGLSIEYFHGDVTVHLGTYSIGEWPRHTEKTFNSEAAAYAWAEATIQKAKEVVDELA